MEGERLGFPGFRAFGARYCSEALEHCLRIGMAVHDMNMSFDWTAGGARSGRVVDQMADPHTLEKPHAESPIQPMRRLPLLSALLLAWVSAFSVHAAEHAPITRVAEIRALSREEVGKGIARADRRRGHLAKTGWVCHLGRRTKHLGGPFHEPERHPQTWRIAV